MPKKSLNLPEENVATRKYTQTFSVPPAICLSEPYNDKDSLKRTAHKGKQLQLGRYHGADAFTNVASEAFQPGIGYLTSSLFKMAPSLTSAGDNYKGKAPYQEVQRYKDKYAKNPDVRPKGAKRLGFGSADFPKRDEYSNVMSTERLRETIHKEDTLAKRRAHPGAEEEEEGEYGGEETLRASGGIAPQQLYDVVNRMPDVSFKYRRDDRQGRFFYMHQRTKEAGDAAHERALVDLKGLRHLTWLDQRHADRRHQEGRAWVQAQLPNGTRLSVLVDRGAGQVLAQRTLDGGQGGDGGY